MLCGFPAGWLECMIWFQFFVCTFWRIVCGFNFYNAYKHLCLHSCFELWWQIDMSLKCSDSELSSVGDQLVKHLQHRLCISGSQALCLPPCWVLWQQTVCFFSVLCGSTGFLMTVQLCYCTLAEVSLRRKGYSHCDMTAWFTISCHGKPENMIWPSSVWSCSIVFDFALFFVWFWSYRSRW